MQPGRPIGTGKIAEVYEYGPHVLKLYRAGTGKAAAFREAAILARVEELGLPAPGVHGVVTHEGRWGVVMDRAEGEPWAELMLGQPERVPELVDAMAALHRRIHGASGIGLPRLGDRLIAAIGRAPRLADAERQGLIERVAGMPPGDRLCHGDFHPYNVMGTIDAPVVVDWPDAHQGSPAADICRSYLLLGAVRPELTEMMLDAGVRAEGIAREEIVEWLPVLAGARLGENVPEEEERLLAIIRTAPAIRP